MKEDITDNAVTFYDLEWDTEYFGVTSAKAILNKPLTLNQWDELKTKFRDYQFISIVNLNSDPVNTQLMGKDTSGFLADVNIQFVKKIKGPYEMQKNITVHQSLKRNDQVLEIADFRFSKFTEDPELAKRGGDQVYRNWLINSFDKSEKYYALSKDKNGDIKGFLLHSYSDNACVIELIAVSQNVAKGGIGTSLFKAVENEAHRRGCGEIRVGTQVRNLGAINFYHKVGCKQVGCHQVHHLWNL
ncbi:GNAT family N-acetyltransferase [Peribacillus simplex]|uniref:GNAT family N-acetyltransferase n=1 Tax=Peribacillus simplex TaxID=1478 RepID=UPI0024C0180A|nr:GNAT family N-acetyltransferase [Peribacillus simplex]WHY96097.1 GNAT family N-acetyltransferase [Peribacillus simplex]